MKVGNVMKKETVTVFPQASFVEVWEALFKKHTHALPVIDKNRVLVGIIVIQDVLTRLYPSYSDTLEEFLEEANFEDLEDKIDEVKSLTAKDLMNKDIFFCYPYDPILKALSKMVVRRIRQLPVVDENNKLLGVISKRDIFDKLFSAKNLFKNKES